MSRERFKDMVAGVFVGFGLFLAACGTTGEGAAPPSLAKPVIDNPGGSRAFYRTEDSSHVISLFDDGTYRSESSSRYGEVLGSHEGRWSWKKTGTHGAELLLGSNKWELTFVSPDSAAAMNRAAGGRTFAWQFERM